MGVVEKIRVEIRSDKSRKKLTTALIVCYNKFIYKKVQLGVGAFF